SQPHGAGALSRAVQERHAELSRGPTLLGDRAAPLRVRRPPTGPDPAAPPVARLRHAVAGTGHAEAGGGAGRRRNSGRVRVALATVRDGDHHRRSGRRGPPPLAWPRTAARVRGRHLGDRTWTDATRVSRRGR